MITFDFYAYWNGEEVATLFSSVTGLFGSSEYHTLLAVAALAGFLAVAAIAAVRYRAGDMVQYFFAALLLYFVAFVPKATVVVIDERVAFTRAVEGVPLGVAFTAAVTSGIGHWATEAFETAFTDVDAARFSKFGMAFPERAAEAVRNAGPIVPEVRTFVKEFVARCIAPEVADKPEKLRELMAAPDIPTLLQNKTWVNPARLLMREGSVLYCSDAWGTLEQELRTKEIPAQEKLLATKLAGTEKDVVVAMVRQAVPESESLMYGVSRSMEESLKHSLLLNAIPEGIRTTADRSGTPLATAVQISKSQGNLASEISYRTMQTLAASFLPKFRNILEFILIAASPFIFLSMIIVGSEGGKVYRMYFTLFFWLALWAPMAAVVNFLILHVDRQPMNLLVEQFGGVTMAAMDLIRSEGATSQAMAGYVMTLIPVISFVIAKASDIGVTSLASSVMNPAQSAAAAQSSSLAMGNVSVGNVSSGNVSANSTSMNAYDASLKRVDGARYQNTTAWGTMTGDMSSGEITGMKVEKTDLGFRAVTQMGDQDSLTKNITNTTGYGHTDSNGYTHATNYAFGENSTSGTSTNLTTTDSYGDTQTYSSGYQWASTKGHNDSVMFSHNQAQNFGEGESLSTGGRAHVHGRSSDVTNWVQRINPWGKGKEPEVPEGQNTPNVPQTNEQTAASGQALPQAQSTPQTSATQGVQSGPQTQSTSQPFGGNSGAGAGDLEAKDVGLADLGLGDLTRGVGGLANPNTIALPFHAKGKKQSKVPGGSKTPRGSKVPSGKGHEETEDENNEFSLNAKFEANTEARRRQSIDVNRSAGIANSLNDTDSASNSNSKEIRNSTSYATGENFAANNFTEERHGTNTAVGRNWTEEEKNTRNKSRNNNTSSGLIFQIDQERNIMDFARDIYPDASPEDILKYMSNAKQRNSIANAYYSMASGDGALNPKLANPMKEQEDHFEAEQVAQRTTASEDVAEAARVGSDSHAIMSKANEWDAPERPAAPPLPDAHEDPRRLAALDQRYLTLGMQSAVGSVMDEQMFPGATIWHSLHFGATYTSPEAATEQLQNASKYSSSAQQQLIDEGREITEKNNQ